VKNTFHTPTLQESPAPEASGGVPTQAELERRWQARCAQGTFSPSVRGVGTLRVFGRSGDAPLSFPRVESLAMLADLAPDEQWALNRAQQLVTQAREQSRTVVATRACPGVAPDALPGVAPMGDFDPAQESILILNRIVGG